MKKFLRNVIYMSLLIYLGIFIGSRYMGSNHYTYSPLNTNGGSSSKIGFLLNQIERGYVDSVDIAELEAKAIPFILKELDPHSSYIPAKEQKGIAEEMSGKFGGIGVQFSLQNDTVMVVDVVSGGPSIKLGVLAGDRIVEVNDSTITGKDVDNNQVLSRLKGPIGSQDKIGVYRKGFDDIIQFEITRGFIALKSIETFYMISENTGFVKIKRFGEETYNEFHEAIKSFKSSGAKNVIVDLRDNSGGYLGIVIKMVDELLPADQLIVYTEGYNSPKRVSSSSDSGDAKDMRVAVLINEYSASASEIFAGAVQDNDRGLVVGRRSFGKGLVQGQIMFGDQSALRLTTARYHTPAGRCIQKPYDKGNEEYAMDLISRMKHYELVNKDSITFNDSLRYSTLSGRTVYGGGGIMPDIFVPSDTTWYSSYYGKIAGKGLTYYFAFEYTDKNREKLESFKTVQELDRYIESENIFGQFLTYVDSKKIKRDRAGLKTSKRVLKTQVRAAIARNIFGEEGYYRIFSDIDDILAITLEKIEADTLILPDALK